MVKNRRRNWFLTVGLILVVVLYSLVDPADAWIQNLPFGAGGLTLIVFIIKALLVVGLLHFSRKVLQDYEFTIEDLGKKAMETSTGAALMAIALSIFTVSISIAIAAGVMI